jgi:hypothetical protein
LEEKQVMPIHRYKPEQIVTTLRQIEVSIANGKTTPQACKEAEITIQTFYRWRKEYGGLKMDQAKRLKELDGQCRSCPCAGRGTDPGSGQACERSRGDRWHLDCRSMPRASASSFSSSFLSQVPWPNVTHPSDCGHSGPVQSPLKLVGSTFIRGKRAHS